MIKVYHTSNQIVKNSDIYHSRKELDFGQGFYFTTLKEQAIKYTQKFKKRNELAYINIYNFNFETIDLFFLGLITRKQALKRLKYEKPNIQYCIRNNKMLQTELKFIGEEEYGF